MFTPAINSPVVGTLLAVVDDDVESVRVELADDADVTEAQVRGVVMTNLLAMVPTAVARNPTAVRGYAGNRPRVRMLVKCYAHADGYATGELVWLGGPNDDPREDPGGRDIIYRLQALVAAHLLEEHG